eukprot:3937067-Rhodomonas_salina.2
MESEAQTQETGGDSMLGMIPEDVVAEMDSTLSSGGRSNVSDLPDNVVALSRTARSSNAEGSALYKWLQGQLTEILADPNLPTTSKQNLTRIRDEMDDLIPNVEKLHYIATDPSTATMLHQPLARMALDERVMRETRDPLAEMATDLHLILTTKTMLGQALVDPALTPEMSQLISSLTANPDFFAA